MARPKIITYPCTLEEMLRQALPNKRPEDRLKFFRMYIREILHRPSSILATDEEVDREIAKLRDEKFPEPHVANVVIRMQMGLGRWARELRRERAKTAAQKRWTK